MADSFHQDLTRRSHRPRRPCRPPPRRPRLPRALRHLRPIPTNRKRHEFAGHTILRYKHLVVSIRHLVVCVWTHRWYRYHLVVMVPEQPSLVPVPRVMDALARLRMVASARTKISLLNSFAGRVSIPGFSLCEGLTGVSAKDA